MTRTVFVDLDGTMVDPAAGILTAFRKALLALGIEPPQDLGWVIGPPMRQSFLKLLGAPDRVEEGVARYREWYAGPGLLDATPYPGIHAALERIGRDARLFVCTSKPHVFARTIVDHFGLAGHFEGIYGAELDGRHDDKGELIAHMLEREKLDPARICMVGDRKFDVLAARRHAIRSVGVLWGYGAATELAEAGATLTCALPEHLPEAVAQVFA